MIAVAAPALGLVLYLATSDAGLGSVVGVLVVVVVLAALLVASGAMLGIDQPTASAWLLWAWTPAVLLAVGAVMAIGIHLGVELAAGKDPTGQEKAIATAAGAVVTAAVTQVKGWLEKFLAPWMSAKVVCARYAHHFPCTPEGLGPGRQAQEAFSAACGNRVAENWSVTKTAGLLRKIAEAVAAEEVHGAAHWKCLSAS